MFHTLCVFRTAWMRQQRPYSQRTHIFPAECISEIFVKKSLIRERVGSLSEHPATKRSADLSGITVRNPRAFEATSSSVQRWGTEQECRQRHTRRFCSLACCVSVLHTKRAVSSHEILYPISNTIQGRFSYSCSSRIVPPPRNYCCTTISPR